MGWLERLDVLDDRAAAWWGRRVSSGADVDPDYRFDIDDRVVLRASRRTRLGVLAASALVVIAAGAIGALTAEPVALLPMVPLFLLLLPSRAVARVELDASGVTWRRVWFMRAEHTPWNEVDAVVLRPWPSMWPPHVRRTRWRRSIPLRGSGLEAVGGDPLVYAVGMAQRLGIPITGHP